MIEEQEHHVIHTHENKDDSFLTEILLASINYSVSIKTNHPSVNIKDCWKEGIEAMKDMRKLENDGDIWRVEIKHE